MLIDNLIRYRNPLGVWVEDYVSESQIKFLIRNGFVKPYRYKLRGNFYYRYQPVQLRLEFVYYVGV